MLLLDFMEPTFSFLKSVNLNLKEEEKDLWYREEKGTLIIYMKTAKLF